MEIQEQYDLLIEAREWLDDPSHWTRGASWRDRNGTRISDLSQGQVAKTCAIGAVTLFDGVKFTNIINPELARLTQLARLTPVLHLLNSCTPPSSYNSIVNLNDDGVDAPKAYEQVLETYDKAIELLAKQLEKKELVLA